MSAGRTACRLHRPQRPGLERQLSLPRHGGGEPTAPVRTDAEIQRQRDEETARKAADLHWLAEGFAYAKQVDAKGILIDWQADPNFNNEQHLTNSHDWDALPEYVDALRTQTMNFRGQVVLVYGDSHYFKVDQPINLPSGGVLPNFTRVRPGALGRPSG
jgi:hypothetical protein